MLNGAAIFAEDEGSQAIESELAVQRRGKESPWDVSPTRLTKCKLVFSKVVVLKRWLKGTAENRPPTIARPLGPEPPMLPEGYGSAATAGRTRGPEEAQG